MRALRLVLGVAGVALAVVGVLQLRDADPSQLLSLGLWLAGGVLAHDAVLAPLTVVVLLLGTRVLPSAARPAATLGLLVWGAVTLATLNVLLGVGGKPDNETLLGRPYVAWWLALSVLWWAGAAVVAVRAVRRERAGRRPAGPRR